MNDQKNIPGHGLIIATGGGGTSNTSTAVRLTVASAVTLSMTMVDSPDTAMDMATSLISVTLKKLIKTSESEFRNMMLIPVAFVCKLVRPIRETNTSSSV
jgi:hypothetical protein